MLGHYLLSKKYKYAAMTFSLLQSIIAACVSVELTVRSNTNISDVDGEAVQAAVLASIAVLSYNQIYQFFGYLVILLFYCLRYYSFINELARFVRVIGYIAVALLFIYYFGRFFN
jgi:hypothetical protein